MASQSFTDLNGRTWTVAITVGDLRAVRTATGVELARLAEQQCGPLAELIGEPVRFVAVLWELCRGQAAGGTEEQFFRALAGDSLDAAVDAFVEAFASFSPSRLRRLIRLVKQKADAAADLGELRSRQRLEALTPEEILAESNAPAGNSPGSSAATRGGSPSGNFSGPPPSVAE